MTRSVHLISDGPPLNTWLAVASSLHSSREISSANPSIKDFRCSGKFFRSIHTAIRSFRMGGCFPLPTFVLAAVHTSNNSPSSKSESQSDKPGIYLKHFCFWSFFLVLFQGSDRIYISAPSYSLYCASDEFITGNWQIVSESGAISDDPITRLSLAYYQVLPAGCATT